MKPGGPWMAYWQIPLLTLPPWTKSPSKQPFLPRELCRAPGYPCVTSFSFPLTCRIITTAQFHPSMGTRSHLILLILQSLSLTLPGCSLGYQMQPQCECGPVWHAGSFSLVSTCDYINSISHICPHVSNHPPDPRVGIPLSPMGWIEDAKIDLVCEENNREGD